MAPVGSVVIPYPKHELHTQVCLGRGASGLMKELHC